MKNLTGLDTYDAGYLNSHGGGNVDWWHDYIRSELDRAHDFYQSQLDGKPARYEAPEGWRLVPVEPTFDMSDAGAKYEDSVSRHDYVTYAGIYRAMLAAAPSPEAAQ